MQISALIAVRSGSERVKNKNIKEFAKDTSLLEIKVLQAVSSKHIENVYVSSDSKKMLDISQRLGAIPIKREPYYASSEVPMNLVYEHMAKQIECTDIVYLHVTSPLLKDSTLKLSIEKYKSLDFNYYDSLATVSSVHEYLWQNGKPLNYDPAKHPRSQDLPEILSLNFAINIISRKNMIKYKNIVGKRFYPLILSKYESVDVDTNFEFDIAEYLYTKNDSKVKLEK